MRVVGAAKWGRRVKPDMRWRTSEACGRTVYCGMFPLADERKSRSIFGLARTNMKMDWFGMSIGHHNYFSTACYIREMPQNHLAAQGQKEN